MSILWGFVSTISINSFISLLLTCEINVLEKRFLLHRLIKNKEPGFYWSCFIFPLSNINDNNNFNDLLHTYYMIIDMVEYPLHWKLFTYIYELKSDFKNVISILQMKLRDRDMLPTPIHYLISEVVFNERHRYLLR